MALFGSKAQTMKRKGAKGKGKGKAPLMPTTASAPKLSGGKVLNGMKPGMTKKTKGHLFGKG